MDDSPSHSGDEKVARSIVSIFLLLWFSAVSFGGEPPAKSAAELEQIRLWVSQLDDDDYRLRQEASQRLAKSGIAAIDDIAAAIAGNSPETTWRAGDILMQIGETGDEQTLQRVTQALNQLASKGHRSLANSSGELRSRWRQLRHDRAVDKIRRLGGQVTRVSDDQFPEALDWRFARPRIFIIDEEEEIAVGRPLEEVEWAHEVDIEEFLEDVEGHLDIGEVVDVEEAIEIRIRAGVPVMPFKKPSLLKMALDLLKPTVMDVPDVPPVELPLPEPVAPEIDADIFWAEEIVELRDVVEAVDFAEFEVEGIPMAMLFAAGHTHGGGSGTMLRLDKSWKGGAEGLRLLEELSQLRTLELDEFDLDEKTIQQIVKLDNLRVLQLTNTRYDYAQLARLKKQKNKLHITATGQALLGVNMDEFTKGARVIVVTPHSAAHKVGIRAGDNITVIDGVAVANRNDLFLLIAGRKVGEKIRVEILRGNKKLVVEPVLQARQ